MSGTAQISATLWREKLSEEGKGEDTIGKTRKEKTPEENGAWVVRNLKKVVRICLSADPVLDKNGAETGKVSYRAAEAIKALELIGKSCGLFSPKTDEESEEEAGQALQEEERRLLERVARRILKEESEESWGKRS